MRSSLHTWPSVCLIWPILLRDLGLLKVWHWVCPPIDVCVCVCVVWGRLDGRSAGNVCVTDYLCSLAIGHFSAHLPLCPLSITEREKERETFACQFAWCSAGVIYDSLSVCLSLCAGNEVWPWGQHAHPPLVCFVMSCESNMHNIHTSAHYKSLHTIRHAVWHTYGLHTHTHTQPKTSCAMQVPIRQGHCPHFNNLTSTNDILHELYFYIYIKHTKILRAYSLPKSIINQLLEIEPN